MFPNEYLPKAREENLLTQEIAGEVLVYDLLNATGHSLDDVSAAIWGLCDGQRTISTICDQLCDQMGPSINEDLVIYALGQLGKQGLLDQVPESSEFSTHISRRSMMKRAALIALVALPTITSVAVPAPASAMSLTCSMTPYADGCPCTSNGSCNTGCCAPVGVGCITPNSLMTGERCRANCNCQNDCCGEGSGMGPECAGFGSVASGDPCRVNCECNSGSCTGSPQVCV